MFIIGTARSPSQSATQRPPPFSHKQTAGTGGQRETGPSPAAGRASDSLGRMPEADGTRDDVRFSK